MTDGWVGDQVEDARDYADSLAAGDEVENVEDVLRHISGQLEAGGLGKAASEDPLGHIVVPDQGAAIALPSGETTINFKDGTVENDQLGVVAEIVTIRQLSRAIDDTELSLRSLILNADGLASATVEGNENQDVFFQDVPIPFRGFEEVTIELPFPAELSVLASTKELPISLGAVTAHGQRHGERSGTLDTFTAIPVTPWDLWDAYGNQFTDSTVYVAQFDSVSITAENTSGNGNDVEVEVQAKESLTSTSARWRTIGSDTIPDGDHSVFSITERHKLLRTRVTNTANGDTVSASVDYNFANP